MLRVVGTIASPVGDEVFESVTLLVQCTDSSVEMLEGAFSYIECDDTGSYDFTLTNGIYRIYIKYSTNTPTVTLGECGVVDGMPEELDLNNLLTNYTPQIPDWLDDINQEWENTWQEFVDDNNTQHSYINNSVSDGDAKVVQDMSTYVNDVTGQQGAALRQEISAGDAAVYNQSKAYTDTSGNELASNITEVSNSLSTVSQELTTFKTETGYSLSEIENRIDTGEASLGSTITAEVDKQTGEMQLRIADVIETNNAAIEQSISIIENALGETQAAWQIVATVGDLTSAIGMTNNGVDSEIYMQANALRFVDPSDDSSSTTPIFEIADGHVQMDSAYIRELGTASLTSGSVTSPNYSAGASGFSINTDGTAEFNQITARGTIYADAGVFSGRLEASDGYFTGSLSGNTINGANIQGGSINGVVITGSEIYTGTQYYLCLGDNANNINYPSTSIPVACNATVSGSLQESWGSSGNAGVMPNYFAAGDVSSSTYYTKERARYRTIPAGAITMHADRSSFSGSGFLGVNVIYQGTSGNIIERVAICTAGAGIPAVGTVKTCGGVPWRVTAASSQNNQYNVSTIHITNNKGTLGSGWNSSGSAIGRFRLEIISGYDGPGVVTYTWNFNNTVDPR